MNAIQRPAGRYLPDLDVTVCWAENYASAVIANLAANIDDCGHLRLDREPAPVGDCITQFSIGNHVIWRVKLGETWSDATDVQHALDIVRVARAAQLEAATC